MFYLYETFFFISAAVKKSAFEVTPTIEYNSDNFVVSCLHTYLENVAHGTSGEKLLLEYFVKIRCVG